MNVTSNDRCGSVRATVFAGFPVTVRFFDLNGVLLASYTVAKLQDPVPSHENAAGVDLCADAGDVAWSYIVEFVFGGTGKSKVVASCPSSAVLQMDNEKSQKLDGTASRDGSPIALAQLPSGRRSYVTMTVSVPVDTVHVVPATNDYYSHNVTFKNVL